MLTETLSGKCPCCNYDKLLQRYGSHGYFQLDGCPNCGFGYGSNGYPESDDNKIGQEIWLDYAAHVLACYEQDKYLEMFEDDACVVRKKTAENSESITYNDGEIKEHKAHFHAHKLLMSLPKEELRKHVFDWAEKQERSHDVETTIFKYSEEDIKNYMSSNPKIFKQIKIN